MSRTVVKEKKPRKIGNKRVLVLNRSWTPVNVITLEKACVMLFSVYDDNEPKARIIDPTNDFATYTWADWAKLRPENDDDVIRTACSGNIRLPEVILLTRYDKLPTHKVSFSRRTIYRRDNFTCMYCGDKPDTSLLTIDHVLPRAQGGQTTWTNCVLACVDCNSKKANRTPEQAHMKLLKQPFKPNFTLFKGDRVKIPTSWRAFISEIYWSTELQNDNKD